MAPLQPFPMMSCNILAAVTLVIAVACGGGEGIPITVGQVWNVSPKLTFSSPHTSVSQCGFIWRQVVAGVLPMRPTWHKWICIHVTSVLRTDIGMDTQEQNGS